MLRIRSLFKWKEKYFFPRVKSVIIGYLFSLETHIWKDIDTFVLILALLLNLLLFFYFFIFFPNNLKLIIVLHGVFIKLKHYFFLFIYIVTLDTNKYNNSRINSSQLEYQPTIYQKDLNEVSCEKEIAKAYNSLGFASVYNRTNGECVVYQQETVIYPVRVLIEYDINTITFVKTIGDEGIKNTVIDNVAIPFWVSCMSSRENRNKK